MDRKSETALLPKATLSETLGIFMKVLSPNIAKGVIIRRPKIVGAAEHWELDSKSVKRIQALSEKYGQGPLLLKVPFKSMALVLDPADANYVLDHSPEPFATAEQAKQSALNHFEPEMSLVSHGCERATRRRLNEDVLQSTCPRHGFASSFTKAAEQEAEQLLKEVSAHQGRLDWSLFINTWNRLVRRVVLGDAARDDDALTQKLIKLRKAANWGFMHPRRKRLQKQFEQHLKFYYDKAEPNSLAALLANYGVDSQAQPLQQVPQYLFAFEPAGMSTFRALALLCAHPEQAAKAREEIAQQSVEDEPPHMNLLKASVLEALRLWPTTPLVLRQSTTVTTWKQGEMPANTSILIHAPYFHRDDRYLAAAHTFSPEIWLKQDGPGQWPLIPFSGGPGKCPGRHLVLLVTSSLLNALLRRAHFNLEPEERLQGSEPMPALLSPYHLQFKVQSTT